MSVAGGNIFKKIQNYLKLGRLFGATNTWGAIFLGLLTSTGSVTLIDAIKILFISIFAHAYIGAINEYWHIEEDKKHPQYYYKPLVSGDISKKNALYFIYFCLLMMILLSIIFYLNISPLFLILAAFFGTIYTVKGKYVRWAYDFTPSFGAAFLVIYGAFTVGDITFITIVAAICAFLSSVYSEWIDGMKDVETDKKFNVPTTAVRWGYSHDKPLTFRDPNYLYFIFIVLLTDFFYILPGVFRLLTPTYLIIFAIVVIPIQIYLIFSLHGKQDKEKLRRHPLIFLSTMMFMAFGLVIDKITIVYLPIIMLFIVGWVCIFSKLGIRFSAK